MMSQDPTESPEENRRDNQDVSSLTLSSSSHSQGVVNLRWRHHGIRREVERSHQVMNVNKRVEFGHFLRFNDVTADPHYSEKNVSTHKDTLINIFISINTLN